jgi:transposase
MFESEYFSQLATAHATIVTQSEEITLLKAKVVSLEAKLTLVMDILQKTNVKKDSHNSSLPPSTDLFTSKTKSLRPPSVLKNGGQLGHDGTTLKMSATPDVIHDLKNNFCTHCRANLADAAFVIKAKRQVIELPPVVPIYEEYRQYGCVCPNCQHEQIANFPLGVNAPIQYGSSVEAIISYLSVGQYVPFARLQSMLIQVF